MPGDRKTVWKIFLTLSILGIIYWFLFDFLRWEMFDSPSFVGASRALFGLEGGYNFQSRLSKPLVLILPGFLEYAFGLHAQYGFLLQSVVSFYVNGFLVYAIFHKLFKSPETAFTALLVYVMCQPFAIFSLMVLADGPGWMLSLVIIYFSLDLLKASSIAPGHAVLMGAFAAAGLLIKESVIFGFIFAGLCVLFAGINTSAKVKALLFAGSSFLLTFFLTQWLTSTLYADSILLRVRQLQEAEGFVFYNRENIAQVFRIIDFYWVLLIVGLVGMYNRIRSLELKKEALAFGSAVILSLLLMPVFPVVVDRIMFMVAPGLVFFVVFSRLLLGRFTLSLVITGGVFNIAAAWLIYRYDVQGLLLMLLLLYALMVAAALLYNRRNSTQSA